MKNYLENKEMTFQSKQIAESPTRLFDLIVIAICMVLLPSAVIHGLMRIDERIAFGLLIPVLLFGALLSNRLNITRSNLMVIVVVMIVSSIGAFVAGAISQLLMGCSLSAAILAARVLFISLQKTKILRLVSIFTLVLLIGGVIGIIYAYFIGSPIFEIPIGYRTSGFYLTTFSLANIDGFIRPSGIFDEPGALAMFAVMVSMFNDVWRQNHRLNFAIMLLILLTGSLAGILVFILYLISSNYMRGYRKKSLLSMTGLAFVFVLMHYAFPDNTLSRALDTFYTGRFEIVDGRLAGDNRTGQVEEFFSVVDSEILTRGAIVASRTSETYDQSSNPFSIVYGYGFIISIPYFALLLWLAGITIKTRFRNSYASLGLILLLLQRPYLYNMMWSVMIVSVVFLLYSVSRSSTASKANFL